VCPVDFLSNLPVPVHLEEDQVSPPGVPEDYEMKWGAQSTDHPPPSSEHMWPMTKGT